MRTTLTLPPQTLGTISTDSNYAPPRTANNTAVMAKALARLKGEAVTIVDLPEAFGHRDVVEVLGRYYPGMDAETLRNHPLLEAARLTIASGSGSLVLPQTLDTFERTKAATPSRTTGPSLATPGKVVKFVPFSRLKTTVVTMPSARVLIENAEKRCEQANIDFRAGRIGSVRVDDIASQQAGLREQIEHSRPLFAVYTSTRASLSTAREAAMRARDVEGYNALTARIEALDTAATGVLNEGYNPERPQFTHRAQELRTQIYQAERSLGMSPGDARVSVFAPRTIPDFGDPLADLDNIGLQD